MTGTLATLRSTMQIQEQDISTNLDPNPLGNLPAPSAQQKGATPSTGFPSLERLVRIGSSIADQALFVGGTFLANVVLARTQTKEEYGLFTLSYSVFTFLSALHNAAVLEPCTVYGSGRYRQRFAQYLRLMARSNVFVCVFLTAFLLLICLSTFVIAPHFVPRSLFGLGLTVGFLLSGIFLRRMFYLLGKPILAAASSLTYFLTVVVGLWFAVKIHALNSFSVFLILALGWIAAIVAVAARLPLWNVADTFLDFEPDYWREHWKYARWVLVTAFVVQCTTQGYYWVVAGFLSVKDVADLRAMYLVVGPVDQLFIAISYLLIPMLASRYARGKTHDWFSLWRSYALATLAVTLLFAFCVRGLGKPVMHLLYAGKFDGLAPLLFLLALLPVFMGVGNTLANALASMEKPKLVFWGYVSGGAATFTVGIPLVIRFGLPGAVYGMLASGTAYTSVLAIAFVFSLYRTLWRHAPGTPLVAIEPVVSSSAFSAGPASRLSGCVVRPSKLAPIALFAYSRAEHTRKTVDSLRANAFAKESHLFVFADGARKEGDAEAVSELRAFARTIEGFKSVTLVEREKNLGLSRSIIVGVTQLCEEYGRAIIVEDDVLTAADFLTLINAGLDHYESDRTVFSVSGFNYPVDVPESYPYDVFFARRFPCWGWGTWKDRWQTADWSVSDYSKFIADREQRERFNQGGEDLTPMLTMHMTGKADTWDTVWGYTHFRQNAFSVLPVLSRTYNIGLDGSGVHCQRAPFRQTQLPTESKTAFHFPDRVALDDHFAAEIHRLHRRSVSTRIARYVFARLRLR
jgi:O-antigen/teichoic acid export membrane protein